MSSIEFEKDHEDLSMPQRPQVVKTKEGFFLKSLIKLGLSPKLASYVVIALTVIFFTLSVITFVNAI